MNKNIAQRIVKDVQRKLDTWNEYSMFKIKGIGNLSRSDMDELLMYCDDLMNGGFKQHMFLPRGSIKAVFEAYGITIEDNVTF